MAGVSKIYFTEPKALGRGMMAFTVETRRGEICACRGRVCGKRGMWTALGVGSEDWTEPRETLDEAVEELLMGGPLPRSVQDCSDH